MNAETRSGEPPLLAFVSSVMDGELEAARTRVVEVLDGIPFLLPWAFEYTPASGEQVSDAYLAKVREAAFVFWLAGSRTTEPVVNEVREAIASEKRLIVMCLPAASRDVSTADLLEAVKPHAKYKEPGDLDELGTEISLAVNDEIVRALRGAPSLSRADRLEQLGRGSRARCVERWLAAGVGESIALEMANDINMGLPPEQRLPSPSRPLVVLKAPAGTGKSLASERWHQQCIARSIREMSAPIPMFLRARDVAGRLKTFIQGSKELGDPELQGCSIVIDGADEPGPAPAAELLRESRELVRTWPATEILITSRPLSVFAGAEEAQTLPALDPEDARQLVGYVASREISIGEHSGWPPNLRHAIQTPLFAVLLGARLRRGTEHDPPPTRAALLNGLAGDVLADLEPADRAVLIELATRSLARGGGSVPVSEIGGYGVVRRLDATRLVTIQDEVVSFPQIILAQWFAAEGIAESKPPIDELLRTPQDLELWRYPLAMAVGGKSFSTLAPILGPLTEAHPGFASQVIEEGIARWGLAEQVQPPGFLASGTQVRDTTATWLAGLGELGPKMPQANLDGGVRTIGARVDGFWLETAWYIGDETLPPVTHLPVRIFESLGDPSAPVDWIGQRGARPGARSAWAWRWSFEGVRDGLEALLKGRALDLYASPLRDAEIWRIALKVLDLPYFHDEPIDLEEVRSTLPPETDGLITRLGRVVPIPGFHNALDSECRAGRGEMVSPFPVRDRDPGPFTWSPWSPEGTRRRAVAVYQAALEAYEWFVRGLFGSLSDWMQMSVTLPGRLHGLVKPAEPEDGLLGGPTVVTWLEALPSDAVTEVDFLLLDGPEDRQETYDRFRAIARQNRVSRPEASRWLDTSLNSSVLDVFDPSDAGELLYKWLWGDLERIKWTSGPLGEPPSQVVSPA